jgi:hypothetical protein
MNSHVQGSSCPGGQYGKDNLLAAVECFEPEPELDSSSLLASILNGSGSGSSASNERRDLTVEGVVVRGL